MLTDSGFTLGAGRFTMRGTAATSVLVSGLFDRVVATGVVGPRTVLGGILYALTLGSCTARIFTTTGGAGAILGCRLKASEALTGFLGGARPAKIVVVLASMTMTLPRQCLPLPRLT